MSLLSIFYNRLRNSSTFKILVIVIIFDVVFGILRAIRERKLNSTIGIDGIIRKVGMLLSVIFLIAIDYILQINLVKYVPSIIKESLNLEYVGIDGLLNILFILFEFLSILKNMVLCKLPIPAELQKTLENAFKKFTGELDKVIDLKLTVEEKKEGD